MTLSPFRSDDVHGIEGPRYTVAAYCSNPACRRQTQHVHHIWRRSKVGKHDWVVLQGELLPNLTGLCVECHEDITGRLGGHRAAIRYEDGVFWWCGVVELNNGQIDFYKVGPTE